jgi:hypothetical protein
MYILISAIILKTIEIHNISHIFVVYDIEYISDQNINCHMAHII